MTNEEQIKQRLSEIMGLCDDQQHWGIKGLSKLTLAAMNLPPALQEQTFTACQKALEAVYSQAADQTNG